MSARSRLAGWVASHPSVRGLIWDLSTLVAGFWISALHEWTGLDDPRTRESWFTPMTTNRRVAALMAAAWSCQLVGTLLKRAPLHARLGPGRARTLLGAATPAVLILHWTTFLFVVQCVQPHLDLPGDGPQLALAALPSLALLWAVWRPRRPPRPSRRLRAQEHLADALLFASALPILMLWNDLIGSARGDVPVDIYLVVGAIVGLGVVFTVFFVAPRMLFLVEDGRDWRTWLRMYLVGVVPAIAHVLFG